MDVSTITAFSHLLSIKEKLFPQTKEETADKDIGEDPSIYCFHFLEYSFSKVAMKETLELILTKRSDFTIPIRHIDWLIHENQLEAIKLTNGDMPPMIQVGYEGSIIDIDPKSVIKGLISYKQLKGRALKSALKTLKLQFTYANGYKALLPVPELLWKNIYYQIGRAHV